MKVKCACHPVLRALQLFVGPGRVEGVAGVSLFEWCALWLAVVTGRATCWQRLFLFYFFKCFFTIKESGFDSHIFKKKKEAHAESNVGNQGPVPLLVSLLVSTEWHNFFWLPALNSLQTLFITGDFQGRCEEMLPPFCTVHFTVNANSE